MNLRFVEPTVSSLRLLASAELVFFSNPVTCLPRHADVVRNVRARRGW